MRIALQPAFVLHQRSFRETSLIVDLLTKEHGRISVVARGVRQARSRIRPLMQPFVPLLISWQGKNELMTLCSVESEGIPLQLQGEHLLSGLYLNELLMRVLHKYDPYPQLYSVYHETLLNLRNQKKPDNLALQKTLRRFEKKLLEELGYALQLQYDIPHNRPFMADKSYRFLPERGFELCQANENIASALIFSGKSLLAFAAEEFNSAELLRDAKRIMRIALAPLLGSQPLHSRKLFVEVESE